jgi:hypothetical protein
MMLQFVKYIIRPEKQSRADGVKTTAAVKREKRHDCSDDAEESMLLAYGEGQ